MVATTKKKAIETRRKKADGVVAMVASDSPRRGRLVTFSFGSATLRVPAREEEWAQNVAKSRVATKQLTENLVKPGVKLHTRKTTPLFRADPAKPGQIIRVLDGKEERGVFEGGTFKIVG